MLIQMLPDQVSELWDVLKPSIMSSMPGHWKKDDVIASNILQAVLADKMQCWVYQNVDDEAKLEGVVLTSVFHDQCSGVKNLVIYGLASMKHAKIVDIETWRSGLATLIKYGKGIGCHNIAAYTVVPRIVEVAEALKCSKETFLFWEI